MDNTQLIQYLWNVKRDAETEIAKTQDAINMAQSQVVTLNESVAEGLTLQNKDNEIINMVLEFLQKLGAYDPDAK
jgi:Zn ribbon nucleic-acid-binding protein